MLQLNNQTKDYLPTLFQINGVKYIVVPVVMIREGVHNGSMGALFHKKENLEQSLELWEGTPVTVGHPQKDGNFISANSEGVRHIGTVSSAKMVGDKLTAVAVLLENELQNESPSAYNAVINGQTIDVSIGVYSEIEENAGVWNNENYTAITKSYTPDHLALLPNDVGACSIEDGCGIRTNSKVKEEPETQIIINKGEPEMEIKKVDELIANSAGKFTPCDREWLLTQSDEKIATIMNDPEKAKKEQSLQALKGTVTLAEVLELVSDTEKEIVTNAMNAESQRKEQTIEGILANNAEVWTREELTVMSMTMLEKIQKSTKIVEVKPTDQPVVHVSPTVPSTKTTIEPL